MRTEDQKDEGVSRRRLVLGAGAALAAGTAAVVAAPEATVGWAAPIVKAAVMAPAAAASLPPVYPVDMAFVPSNAAVGEPVELVVTFPTDYPIEGLTLNTYGSGVGYLIDTPAGWTVRLDEPSGGFYYLTPVDPPQTTVFHVQTLSTVGAAAHQVIATLETDSTPVVARATLTLPRFG